MLDGFDEKNSKGRIRPLDSDLLLDKLGSFDRDFEKIISSKALRRLAGKTQVLKAPLNPHVRTRRIHTDEVRQTSYIIAENLGLNKSLCQAIALGHDIGHTPYGHLGETVISELAGKEFRHNVFGVVVAQEIEGRGRGLNLSYETLEGILLHSRGSRKMSSSVGLDEYDAVMFADKISYVFSDINDAVRYGLLDGDNLPKGIGELGLTQNQRVNACVSALVEESLNKGKVSFGDGIVPEIFDEIKAFMYKNVYHKIDEGLHTKVLTDTYKALEKECPEIDPAVGLALLTDWEVNSVGQIMLNARKPKRSDFEGFGLFEVIPYIANKNIDYTNANLNWAKDKG